MMKRLEQVTVISAALLALTIAVGCGGTTGTTSPTADGESYRFTMAVYGSPGNAFWTKVTTGAREMAGKLGCKVDIQFANGDAAKQNDILETAIASHTDGIALAINFDEAYDETVSQAIEAGIGVVAFNIDDSQRAAGNARMAYIGQDMEEAGYMIAQRLVRDGGLGAGDSVLCPVETPEAVYAIQRYAGAKRALDEHSIASEVLNTGSVSLEDTLNKLTQYLIGHQDTDAICAMGQMPCEASPQAASDVGLDIPIAGFDLSREIARHIQDGRVLATVDQQPFYQGAISIMQLYYYRKYGLAPCDVNTGGATVDASNVERVAALSDTVR